MIHKTLLSPPTGVYIVEQVRMNLFSERIQKIQVTGLNQNTHHWAPTNTFENYVEGGLKYGASIIGLSV